MENGEIQDYYAVLNRLLGNGFRQPKRMGFSQAIRKNKYFNY